MTSVRHATHLIDLARNTPWMVEVLECAREVMSAPWCIGAGAVRSLVWNALHDYPLLPPPELDLVYFDAACTRDYDASLTAMLTTKRRDFQWDVVNQAFAHTLSGDAAAPPFVSLEHAISCWPETATAVGLWLDGHGCLHIVAPLGLDDLFGLVLRPSPFLRAPKVFQQRVLHKAFLVRWPRLEVVPA